MLDCPDPEWIPVREAAARAGLSPSRIRDWAACGKLDAKRIGRRGAIYVTASSLRELLRHRPHRRRRPQLRLVVDNT